MTSNKRHPNLEAARAAAARLDNPDHYLVGPWYVFKVPTSDNNPGEPYFLVTNKAPLLGEWWTADDGVKHG